MKEYILILIFCLISFPASATDYYVKNGGDDGKSGLDDANAWATIAKVEGTAGANDRVYFKCGSTWDVSSNRLDVPGSGMTFGDYDTGVAPIFDCNSGGYGIFIDTGDTGTTVTGLIIREAAENTAGIYVNASGAEIQYCEFYKNNMTTNTGGSIRLTGNADGTLIHNNTFGTHTCAADFVLKDGGKHTGAGNAATLTDSTKSWTPDEWIGYYVINMTDGSWGEITDNDGTTITATLAGGSENDWDNSTYNDNYYIADSLCLYSDMADGSHVWISTKDSGGTIDNLDIYSNTFGATARQQKAGLLSFYSHAIDLVGDFTGSINIYDNTIRYAGTHGLVIRSCTSVSGTQISIYGNTIRHAGNAGISLWQVDNVTSGWAKIYENDVSYCDALAPQNDGDASACGIHLNDAGLSNFIKTYVYENEIYKCYSVFTPDNEDSSGIGIDYDADNVEAYHNLIYDNWGKGIYVFNADSALIYGNVIYGNDSGIIISGNTRKGDDCLVYNNNLYKNNNGSYGPDYNTEIYTGNGGINNTFMNNICYTHDSNYVYDEDGNSTFDYSCAYRESGGNLILKEGVPATWATWQGAGNDANGINDNPDFTNPGGDVFTLQSGSPCLSTGVDLGNGLEYCLDPASSWPDSVIPVDPDSFGAPGWPMGAFEYEPPPTTVEILQGTFQGTIR